MNKKEKAFTLIEMMIVVSVLLILTSIAVPKFMNLIRLSNEGATKGSLGSIRSALDIYFADTEGIFPARVAGGVTGLEVPPFLGSGSDNYLDEIPACKEHCSAWGAHKLNSLIVTPVDGMGANGPDDGGWAYQTPTGITYSTMVARAMVNCAENDYHGTVISKW